MAETEPDTESTPGPSAEPRDGASPGAPRHLFCLFGATGDLARRKLIPALFRLRQQGLREGFRVLGLSRDRDLDDQGFRELVRRTLRDAGVDDLDAWCDRCLYHQPVDTDDPDYGAIAERVEAIEGEADLSGNRVFYLAVPPSAFPGIVAGLGEVGLTRSEGFTRLVVEKPFGRDLASARELNRAIQEHFDESEIYRIDHFLGKETVQNLLVLRFANAIVETLWSRDHVESVEITVAERLGLEGRVGYYDHVGALRDMVQNHLTQILTLIAMGVPASYDAESIRNEKLSVLRSIVRPGPDDVVFGRYGPGRVDGSEVPGYLQEEGIPVDSRTETFVALRLAIDDWRWQGVPFYLRTGKRMARSLTEVAVRFRRPPVKLFHNMELAGEAQDVLVLTLQPDEGFALYLDVKRPGTPSSVQKVPLDFRYASLFGELPDAYVTLLLDVLLGDRTLFVSDEEAELAWSLYGPLLDHDLPVHEYASGSWGPAEAEHLLERDGRSWRDVE